MKKKNNGNIILEEYQNDYSYEESQSNLNIKFNRIAFIFFIIFTISLIYSIQLLHLGSLQSNNKTETLPINKKNNRADIIDINGNYLVKTVRSIDIGINPVEVIDKKKLLINLQLIFPKKNFSIIKKKLDSNNFFYLEKKITAEKYEQIMLLGDKSIKPEEKLIRIYPYPKKLLEILQVEL